MSGWLWLLVGVLAVVFFGPSILIAAAVIFVAVWAFLFVVQVAIYLWPVVLLALFVAFWWRTLQEEK